MLETLNTQEILTEFHHLITGTSVKVHNYSYELHHEKFLAEFCFLTFKEKLNPDLAFEICMREIQRWQLLGEANAQ